MYKNNSNQIKKIIYVITIIVSSFVLFLGLMIPYVFAQNVDNLKKEISDFNAKIATLEVEIAKYEAELNVIGSDKRTLQNAIKELNISRKKLLTNIKITKNQIYSTTLQIQRIKKDIINKRDKIADDTEVVASTIRSINEIESQSMVEIILGQNNLDEFWNQLETMQRFQVVIRDELKKLKQLKSELENTKTSSEKKKSQLTNFNTQLSGQKSVLDGNLSGKNVLLNKTVKKESSYQALLNKRKVAREQFENEMLELESKLRIAIDPNSIPPFGAGILRWPFSNNKLQRCKTYKNSLGNINCITQYFGNTPFATKNPQIYNGGGHNGIDFRSSVGTKVKVALSGTIVETGNTDLQKGCYSYGKWILVKHNNGLSTLYAHLSQISVKAGQKVITGDVIAFSGGAPGSFGSGFSTGPHLHLTVYASQGVKVRQFTKSRNCKNVRVPIAPLKAYLNPLSYL